MPRKRKKQSQNQPVQLTFEDVIKSGKSYSREEVVAETQQAGTSRIYDPITQTADYMQRSMQSEEAWETTIQTARKGLLDKDPRELYFDFFSDLKRQIELDSTKAARLASLLEQVAIRGFGMTRNHIRIEKPPRGGTRWRVQLNTDLIQTHLESHVIGENFINPVSLDEKIWTNRVPLIGASDVSQHRSAVPIPARFFKRSVPFVLNNAAGTLYRLENNKPKYDNLFNPKPDEALLRWMLIDPSYQDELEPEDYQRCLASAMDVGQYKFDFEYLLKTDKRPPDVIFRDGSLFPQDAYLDNFVVENRRGEFTREAIREMLSCLSYIKEIGGIYCGVAKNVQLKIYSAVVDWYIARNVDRNWEIGNYTFNDGQAMSLLLSSPYFVGDNLQEAVATCLIRRSFTTRANLNVKTNLNKLSAYFRDYQEKHDIYDITPYQKLCEIAHVYMFFIGHSKSPQQQLPRYEFFHSEAFGETLDVRQKILSAIQHCGLMNDEDHSFMADKPITYLIPSVTQQAHLLSKDVGKYIDTATGQWIMARYKKMLPKNR